MHVILLGAPGAGKGTQAALLAKELRVPHVASGDIFRQGVRERTQLGLLAQSYMAQGQLVPDVVTIQMVLERLAQSDCAKGWILDGFPRTVKQAEALDQALAKDGRSVDRVINIRVSEEELARRLSGRWICRVCQAPYHLVSSPPKVAGRCDRCGGELYQRDDDRPETVRQRLGIYHIQTAPLIDYYAKAGKLVEVDGEQDVGQVGQAVLALLKVVK